MVGQISPQVPLLFIGFEMIYYGCHELPYGKEDQTLLIDNEPSKAIHNSKWSGLFLESFHL
jgi:hypothetical protein